jgi:ATPase involved in DNA repair
MFYIKELKLLRKGGKVSSVSFNKGLNIVYGESNSGKSLIYNCLDYMMAGGSTERINVKLEIQTIVLVIMYNDSRVEIRRDLNTNSFHVESDNEDLKGDYGIKASKKLRPISDFWFKLMEITPPEKVLKNISGETQNMYIRTIYHTFMVDEERSPGFRSVLIPLSSQNPKMHAASISSLVYLATGDSGVPRSEGITKKEKEIKNNAVVNFVDASMLDLAEYQDELSYGKSDISPEEIQRKIDDVIGEIAALENKMSEAVQKRKEVAEKLIKVNDSISENKALANRYQALQSQYASDIKRLTFLTEGALSQDQLSVPTQCPFCNGELSKEKEESCLEAAIREVEKIEYQIKDLKSVQETLNEDIDNLEVEHDKIAAEKSEYDCIIRGEINPQIEKLRDCLAEYTEALSRAKAEEMFGQFKNILYRQLGETTKEDEVMKIDIRNAFAQAFSDRINTLADGFLKDCNYDNYKSLRFDEGSFDLVVNDTIKASQGEGYRAFLNAVLAITVQDIIRENGLCNIGFMCIDSPILSLKEKKDAEDISETMKAGLFKYFVNHSSERQMIIVENTVPDIDYKDTTMIHFTKDEDNGRYGFVEDYRE